MKKNATTNDTKALHNIQKVKEHLKNKNPKWRRWLSKEIPWFLVIGPTRSGKTSLIQTANYNILPSDQNPPSGHTKNVNFWEGEDHILLDTSGDFMDLKKNSRSDVWEKLQSDLNKYRGPSNIDGIVLVIDTLTLCQKEYEFAIWMEHLSRRLLECSLPRTGCPLHIVISQIDLLPGITSAFQQCSLISEESWLNIPLYDNNDKQTPKAKLQHGFHQLVSNFDNDTIKQMHPEKELTDAEKYALTNARIHLEALEKRCLQLINRIAKIKRVNITQIAFTGTQQSIDQAIDLSSKIIPLESRDLLSKRRKQEPHFFNKGFLKNLNTVSALANPINFFNRFKLPLTACIIVLIICVFIIPMSAIQSQQNKQQKNITQLLQQNMSASLLDKIYLTQQAIIYDEKNKHKHFISYLLPEKLHQLQTLKKLQKNLLQNGFLPIINQTITQQLNSDINSKSTNLYETLKAYLIIHSQGKMDKEYLENWLQEQWAKQNIDADQRTKLNTALTLAYSQPLELKDPTDNILVAKARDTLTKLPMPQLAYDIMVNTIQIPGIDLSKLIKNTDTLHLQVTQIPAIFLRKNFDKMYNKVLPSIMLLINRRDWVIEQNLGSQIDKKNINSFINQMREIYLSDYGQQWQRVVSGITLPEPKSLGGMQEQFSEFTKSNSSLWGILTIIMANTDSSDQKSDFYQQVTMPLTALHGIDPTNIKNNPIPSSLGLLNKFLSQIMNSRNPSQSAFNISSNRAAGLLHNDPINNLLQIANEQPPIIKDWCTALAKHTWQQLLNLSAKYIDTQWQSQVFPIWKTSFVDRFPIYTNSKIDTSLEHFTKLFANNGILDNFFNYYLKPFVDQQQAFWKLKKIDNNHLPLSKQTINMFIRANIIKNMFFTESPTKPTAKMTLHLENISPKNVSLYWKYNESQHTFNNRKKTSINLSWPNTEDDRVSMIFKQGNEIHENYHATGPWAILHMLYQGSIITSNKSNKYTVMFGRKQETATFDLYFADKNNPLIPDLLNKFRCIDTLLPATPIQKEP